MATTRFAVGAVLDTVTTAATVVSTTLNVIGKSAQMASAFMDQAADTQALRYLIEAEDREQRIIDEVSDAEAKHRAKREAEMSSDPVYKRLYAESHQRYSQLLAHKKHPHLKVAAE
jgi:hypothetical protein